MKKFNLSIFIKIFVISIIFLSLSRYVYGYEFSTAEEMITDDMPYETMITLAISFTCIIFSIIYTFMSILNFKIKTKNQSIENSSEYKLVKERVLSVIKNSIIIAFLFLVFAFLWNIMTGVAKPVIYLYPEQDTIVNVSVRYPEKLSCVYPEYNEDGWNVLAKPNGDLTNLETGRNYYCLYWEGSDKKEYKFEDGFVVAGEDSAKFLEEKLAILGLNEREANEFIIYWLPKLEVNKYNLIRFETVEEIENYMPLEITPEPDSVIRVIMDFKPLKRKIEIKEQVLETPKRTGFTVVEWGGSEF